MELDSKMIGLLLTHPIMSLKMYNVLLVCAMYKL